jgi:phosphonate transport system ATP-binding protein
VLTNVLSGRLGYVPTLPSLFQVFSAEDRAKAMANLEQVDLSEKAHVRADSLSGGQQQRVGIARALMQDPKLILADEPVASLDPVLAHSILKYLELLNKDRGITVLCSLHFLDLVHRYATRAIALKDGNLVFEGLPKQIDDAQFKAIYGQEAERISII